MKNIAFVAARMRSNRLPGKVLKPLVGKPALEHVLANLQNCSNLTGSIVVMPVLSMDDLIEKLAEALGIKAVCGSVHDVLDRFRLVAILTEPDRVIRVTGDEPLIDPEVVII